MPLTARCRWRDPGANRWGLVNKAEHRYKGWEQRHRHSASNNKSINSDKCSTKKPGLKPLCVGATHEDTQVRIQWVQWVQWVNLIVPHRQGMTDTIKQCGLVCDSFEALVSGAWAPWRPDLWRPQNGTKSWLVTRLEQTVLWLGWWQERQCKPVRTWLASAWGPCITSLQRPLDS